VKDKTGPLGVEEVIGPVWVGTQLGECLLDPPEIPGEDVGVAAIPVQVPWLGRALKSQGQPNAQLQFFRYLPFMRQEIVMAGSSPNGARRARRCPFFMLFN